MSGAGDSKKVVLFALAANLGIAIAKLSGALISGSASMLAEAVHSFVDTSNQLLLLVGGKRSRQKPTNEHPLGFGREAFFWSFIVAILLFSLGGLFAIYEGIHKLTEHASMASPALAMAILAVSLGLEWFSFHACMKQVRAENEHANLWQWFHKTTSADLLVVFTEDAAAMAGLTIAMICLAISWLTGDPRWDAVGSILVGSVLVVVAVLLAIEIKSLIIGEAPATDFTTFLEKEVAAHIPGGRLLRLVALQLGAKEVLLSYKVSPGSVTDVATLIDAINALERKTRAAFPEVAWQFVEPDTEA